MSTSPDTSRTSSSLASRRTLVQGVLMFRWLWLLWMAAMAFNSSGELARPVLAWISLGAAVVWTIWLSAHPEEGRTAVLLVDLVLSVWLVIASGLVVPEGYVVSGRPFFATGYPLSTPLFWGVARGWSGGLLAGLVLGLAHLCSRPINGTPLEDLTPGQLQNLLGAMANYAVAGVAVGLVSTLLRRSERELEVATEALVAERERAARLSERESLARQIHDSVLQALSLVHKRGRELSKMENVPSSDLESLADIAQQQESELRALVSRVPEDRPRGRAPLREALERVGRDVQGLDVTVSSVGPIWMQQHSVDELAAAVRQALENVVHHAGVNRANVFADDEGERVTVSVRDDGGGFEYDEALLLERGKVGILKSMKGRVSDLGGDMQITTAPDRGTEVEFYIPKEAAP